MNVLMSFDDKQAIREVAARFFAERTPLAGQLKLSLGRVDPPRELFAEMASLDFFSQSAPESVGGLGLSGLAAGLIAEAAGGELVHGPLVDQLIAISMAVSNEELVGQLMSADLIAAVGFDRPGATRLSYDPGSHAVSGTVRGVRFGDSVDRWILSLPPAAAFEGAVVVVDPQAAGIEDLREEPSLDPLWRSVSASLRDAPVMALLPLVNGIEAHQDYACGLVAAYSVGASRRVLEEAIVYVKEREQFGRPIGSFQAIKHRAANAYSAVLHARALTFAALDGATRGGEALRMSRIVADGCYRLNAETALQMHGGIGFTAESVVHLFLKNAQQLRMWPTPASGEFEYIRRMLGLDTNA
jgi:alkylation response protein AidB-like acyl-CoA dehydrogenase